MDVIQDTLALSRIQFALTAMFHMLWPVLTTGMAIFLVVVEGLWLKTRDPQYYHHARFWSKLYVLNFGIGVASGLPLQFQFGTNWGPFSEAVGDFMGSVLGFEATMAFMLEAGFLGIMIFGWDRVHPKIHFLATILVALGANLSTFWIISANSWMQTPAGGVLIEGRFVVQDYFQAIFNPFMISSFLHMFFATLETSLFVIGGISAWYILRQRSTVFFSKALKIVLALAILVAPLQLLTGHSSGKQVYRYQPTKMAAIEAKWETIPAGDSASWSIVALPNEKKESNDWQLEVPNALGYILELNETLSTPLRGLKEWNPEDRPKLVALIFYSFRLMIGIGTFFVGLMLWSTLQWIRGKLSEDSISQQKWLLRAWVFAAPLGYIAVESGWIVRCVGRQPWTLYGLIRTSDSVSNIPAGNVAASLACFIAVYCVLLFAALYFGSRIIRKGPNLDLAVPQIETPMHFGPAAHLPDKRPVETHK